MQTSNKYRRLGKSANAVTINITPLVDVLLILVTILILLVPFSSPKKLPIEIPSVSSTTEVNRVELSTILDIEMSNDGQLYLKSQAISESELLSAIDNNKTVNLSIAKQATYEKMSQLVSKIQQKNPKSINLMVDQIITP